ncbi:RHS repeat-associated core domain-containing protein [Geothrix sp. 21YS21S-4]|uniref:RHS repeat-associated core domain-containing protein n=1 Tax=Geothrix sp. 21YS21S-4 TaxID=3068889 RepID=UPI0027B8F20D|nr:RHS repeat-associated core domain-containing protein [Geothrix sp. 21YS21S-4]
MLTNAAGTVIGRQKSLPFGERMLGSGEKSFRRFTNHEDGTQLPIYMQARMYLPTYGRFAQVDPAYDHSDDGLNLYSYVSNQPITQTDPDGMREGTGNSHTPLVLDAQYGQEGWITWFEDPMSLSGGSTNRNSAFTMGNPFGLWTSENTAAGSTAVQPAQTGEGGGRYGMLMSTLLGMTGGEGTQHLSQATLKELGLPTSLEVTAVQLVAAVLAQEFRGEGPAAVQAGAIAFVNRMIEAQNGANWGQKDGVSQPGLQNNLMLQLISAPNQFTALAINPGRIGKILAGTVDSPEYSYAVQKLGSYNDRKTTLTRFRQIWNGASMLYDIGGRDQWRSNGPKHQLRDNSLIIGHTDFFNED